MSLVSQSDLQKIYNALSALFFSRVSDAKSTSLYSCLATLMTTDDRSPVRYSNLFGILSLQFDRRHRAHFLRLYNIDSMRIDFQCELYFGFELNYRIVSQQLYVFDFYGGSIFVGFRNNEQAEKFLNKVKNNSPKSEEETKNMKSSNPFSKLMSKFLKQEPTLKEQPKIQNQMKSTVTFDPATCQFETESIPPEWNKVFKDIGYGDKELTNRDSAKILFQEIVTYAAVKEAEADVVLKNQMENTLKKSVYELIQTPIQTPQPETNKMRNALFKQITEGNFKLKTVKTEGDKVAVQQQDMDREEREGLANYLRQALRKRRKALHRFDEEDGIE